MISNVHSGKSDRVTMVTLMRQGWLDSSAWSWQVARFSFDQEAVLCICCTYNTSRPLCEGFLCTLHTWAHRAEHVVRLFVMTLTIK